MKENRNHKTIYGMKKAMLLACVLCLLFTSCDMEHIIDYYVVNSYEEPIVINYKIYSGNIKSLEIEVNDTVLIHSERFVFGTVGVDHFKDDIAIVDMTIHNNNNSIPITQNEWRYKKIEKYHAEQYLIIDTTLLRR